jgi:hypothetical protein
MPLDSARARQRLKDFDLKNLFVEDLGWERHSATHDLTVDGGSYRLGAVAHKRGFAVFICEPGADGRIPDYPTRRKIDRQATKLVHEHLIVFVDAGKTTQTWQWLKREPGKPVACREHTFYRHQPGDALIQKLQALSVSIDEEAGLTLPEVAGRVRAAFDVERVTKRFYDRFKSEHAAFLKFLKGIPDDDMQRWYVSVMLNRLMFIYFIQKKGFLGDSPNYLRDRLAESKKRGKDRFYRDFLCPLFFEGFAKKEGERSAVMNKLLGKVPYLNGGLFLRHQIEELYGDAIQIGDGAFEKLFAFFEQYTWHLDERPLKKDDEINPDVLGYIFEKYINQKQMGAYYSKEDITGYISQNTVIPYLFDQARKECRIAFEGPNPIWRLLQADPDRYIYDAVKKGVRLELPPEIAAGLSDVSKRTQWNKAAPEEYALPTEIWREVVARRKRYEEVRSKLAAGEIRSINDLITYNLDIRQFAQDVIETCEGPELLRAFYKAIKNVSVLDPACGSGAFLFAALNILESLYEACLDRMEIFLEELERSGQKHRPEKFADFKKELERVAAHPNRKYFIYKAIIVNNVFGVDIMEEATEICKLRLFLKLVAQIERLDQIEPLPDIDFNIRAGNTLVGYASYDEVKRAVSSKLDFEGTMEKIEEKAQEIDRLFGLFREMQSDQRMESNEFATAKEELLHRLRTLENELNRNLAGEYGVKPDDRPSYQKWLNSHRPFHWFIEFYGIMNSGGFNVIVGNPPWVEFYKVRDEYGVRGYRTLECNNLWAFFVERSLRLLRQGNRCGLIVPMSLVCTERMTPMQEILREQGTSWLSSYESDSNPGQLFDGVKQNVSILLHTSGTASRQYTTRLYRFFSEARDFVFAAVEYCNATPKYLAFGFPKISESIESRLLEKLFAHRPLAMQIAKGEGEALYVHRIAHYYIKCVDFVPYFRSDRDGLKKSEDYKEYRFRTPIEPFVALLNSSAFYFYWQVFFDGFKAGKLCIESFPCSPLKSESSKKALVGLGRELMADLKKHARRLKAKYEATGSVEYDQFYPRFSKPIMDRIDQFLADHYQLTAEEMDFIISYDIKFRSGAELEEAED